MENYAIYYFSGTGNSMSAAKRLSANLNASAPVAITAELLDSDINIDCDTFVLVYPVYAYSPPAIVKRFLKTATINANYVSVLHMVGTKAGGSPTIVKSLLKKQGLHMDSSFIIKSVENYVSVFGLPKDCKLEWRNKFQDEQIDKYAPKIARKERIAHYSPRVLTRPIAALFFAAKPLLVKTYRVKNTCNGCGLCQKLCPAHAITIQDNKPAFSAKKCEHCQACLHLCPQRSITFGRVTAHSRRYKNPHTSLQDFIRR